jgi:hypothetical protein
MVFFLKGKRLFKKELLLVELLKALVCPLLLSKPNLSSGGLQVEVLVIVQELQLLGTQGHERKTGVTAALVVQHFQGT